MNSFGRRLSIVGSLVTVLTTGCDSDPTSPSLTGASADLGTGGSSAALTTPSMWGLSDAENQELLAFTIERAKTKCGKQGESDDDGEEDGEGDGEGKDYIRIGGHIEGLDPSAPLTVVITGDPAIFGPVDVTIPGGTKGPVDLPGFPGGTIKVTLPKNGTGNFHINVDAEGLNNCDDPAATAQLILTLNGVTGTITLKRKTDSKFGS